jgi:glycosyltransferase involved in cell wall biosynthesis
MTKASSTDENLVSLKEDKQLMVSVWVITYNHASYIGKCLENILNQETNFRFEICLGEDDSNDGTREICRDYAEKHPDTIRLFERDRKDPKRKGCAGSWQFNYIETLRACRGKYIALCDGDDFWSNKFKLQKQVDFLEKNPKLSGCFHKVGQVDNHGKIICADMGYPPIRKKHYSLDYLLRYGVFSSVLSVVFRNRENLAPDWFKKSLVGDILLHTGNLLHGKYGFIDEVMGYYRIHSQGLASGSTRKEVVKITIQAFRLMGQHYNIAKYTSYRRGLRTLYLSYFIESILCYCMPLKIKQQFDLGYGRHLRSFIRRILP